jgi:hypothetical protein
VSLEELQTEIRKLAPKDTEPPWRSGQSKLSTTCPNPRSRLCGLMRQSGLWGGALESEQHGLTWANMDRHGCGQAWREAW